MQSRKSKKRHNKKAQLIYSHHSSYNEQFLKSNVFFYNLQSESKKRFKYYAKKSRSLLKCNNNEIRNLHFEHVSMMIFDYVYQKCAPISLPHHLKMLSAMLACMWFSRSTRSATANIQQQQYMYMDKYGKLFINISQNSYSIIRFICHRKCLFHSFSY